MMFLLFAVVMAGLLYLHFAFAHAGWKRIRGNTPRDIDPSYVRREDYFGQSFRTKLQSWLELPVTVSDDGRRTIQRPMERIQLTSTLQLPARAKSDDVLVVQGDFTCGPSSELTREIYVEKNALVGLGSQCQAIAGDGDITLASGVEVARWVDSRGVLRLSADTVVNSRSYARKAAILELGSRTQSVCAPEVTTGTAHPGEWAAIPNGDVVERLQVPPEPGAYADTFTKAGIDTTKFVALGAGIWIYQGSFRPSSAIHLAENLIVRGDCEIPANSLLEGDLKASGSVLVGRGADCRGNMVAGKSLGLGPMVRFSGVIHANEEILLSRGISGESANGPVAVDAGSWLFAEEGIKVRGKLSSGERVRVIDSAAATTWWQKHKFPARRA